MKNSKGHKKILGDIYKKSVSRKFQSAECYWCAKFCDNM